MTPIIEVTDLKKHYPVRKGLLRRQVGTVFAVDGVSFSINEGETLGLVGESGCGKSTVARTVLRLIEPSGGSITLDGRDITGLSRSEMRPVRREMQIIFQDPFSSLNPRMRAGAIVGEVLEVHGLTRGQDTKARVAERFQQVGLRRAAPAHLHRAGAGPEPEADRLRRAGVGAGRVDPGAGDQPDDGSTAGQEAVLSVHRA